uniref:Reverse transcriptase n=1 Tax=Salvator merianae TaxID=96440 RepID=A0A8D0B7S4_SALMN
MDKINTFLNSLEISRLTEEQYPTLTFPIQEQEVRKTIKGLKLHKAPGEDGYSSDFYKLCEETPLLMTMNNILKNGEIPESWEKAFITLIPKEGQDLTLSKNYRPISLLNNDYKIFASIMATRLKYVL